VKINSQFKKQTKMKTKKLLTILAIVSVVLIASCKKDTFVETVGVCPYVVSTNPTNTATGVPLDQIITVTFNEKMNPATITQTSFSLQDATKNSASKISGTLTYDETTFTIHFVPSSLLAYNAIYTGKVLSSVKDLMGNALQSDYVWTFTTGAMLAPVVIYTDPGTDATGVEFNKIITATFNVPMDPATINQETFIVKKGTTPVAGTVSYSGTTASFTPTSNLLSCTVYTATITTGAKNLFSNPLANDYVWGFTSKPFLGPQPPDLKSVIRFGIIAGVGISNNAGQSEIHDMDIGISPGFRSSITGFPPAIVINGAIYAADDADPVPAMLIQAKQDLTDAYLFAEGATTTAPATIAGDQGGKTLAPGIYKSTSTLLIQSGDLTLDAQGDANAVWIFQIASDFTTIGGAGGNVILSGGAQAKNVFWQVGSSATIGDYTSFNGTVLALTSITMNSHATATGRMLAINGAVVLTSTNKISKP